ncbi:hypothetical protein JCM13304A_14140 [Desulfothermus okinawensis JCM 13304]
MQYKKTTKSIKHASTLISEIIDQKGGTEKFALIRLWKNWEHVLGENLAKLAKPLGTNKKTLIIGVEDSLLMQELTFFTPDILKKINEFLGYEPFDKIIYKLLEDKTPLDRILVEEKSLNRRKKIKIPSEVGNLKKSISKKSPVYRAYIKYLELIQQIKNLKEESYNER